MPSKILNDDLIFEIGDKSKADLFLFFKGVYIRYVTQEK